jgi:hypothetical protein
MEKVAANPDSSDEWQNFWARVGVEFKNLVRISDRA